MTAPDLVAIKARLAAATPGPWSAEDDEDSPGAFLVLSDPDPDTKTNLIAEGGKPDHWKGWANVKFIAHAREDIPALLSYIEQQKAEIERLKTACPCHERAMQMLGDQRVGVMVQNLSQWPPVQHTVKPAQTASLAVPVNPNCTVCGGKMSLRFWDRPGGAPGNGYACDTCHPPAHADKEGV